jgi:hypothetical protein
MSNIQDFPTNVLENGQVRLEYFTTIGPRITSLTFHGSPNLFAYVPDIFWDTSLGKYFPLGGHRLWISPELPEKTYIPDEPGLQIQTLAHGVECSGIIEKNSGVRKYLRIELHESHPIVHLTHTITNENEHSVELAPWCISMFRQGGTVIMPQPSENVDPHGLLPNRLLILWPYTRIHDPRLELRDDSILMNAQPALPPVKLGYKNTAGWMAYWHEGILFRKKFEFQPEGIYPDGGCNAEVYCGDRFVELESLGRSVTLEPGQNVQHEEIWELYHSLDVDFVSPEIRKLLET